MAEKFSLIWNEYVANSNNLYTLDDDYSIPKNWVILIQNGNNKSIYLKKHISEKREKPFVNHVKTSWWNKNNIIDKEEFELVLDRNSIKDYAMAISNCNFFVLNANRVDELLKIDPTLEKYIQQLKEKQEDISDNKINNTQKTQNNGNNKMSEQPKNQILYGPPGTGKTYNTVVEAIKIIQPDLIQYDDNNNVVNYQLLKEKFDEYKKQGRIEFVTFHQSYSYEEFVEGIKPVLNADNIKYEKKEGVFKRICERAAAKTESNFDEVYQKFINDVQEFDGQYCLETLTHKRKFAINVNSNNSLNLLVGENLEKQGTLTKEHLKNRSNWKSYSTAIYQHLKDKYELIEIKLDEAKPHILIIDEINRGNISKIFGELITLIEEDKRLGEANEVTVKLPYAEEGEPAFGVPSNLYIIGTMNTSDRSIASVDIALRRRFKFKEMMPNENLINEIANKDVCDILDNNNQKLYSVNLVELLKTLNKRITILLDRDHQIGHSYFLDLIKDKNGAIKENLTETELKEMWFSCIQPLLNEYFYGDWEKLQALLGKAEESNNAFIKVIKNDCLLNGYSCDTNELCDFTHKDDINFKEALSIAFKNAISKVNQTKVEKDANTTT